MPSDEIRDLIGRYATGSLTDAETKLLFEAALEDQKLFDELAQEQELHDLIAQPGARARLIHAVRPLESPEQRGFLARIWSARIWPWAGMAAAFAAGVVMTVMLRPSPQFKQQQFAVAQPPVSEPAPAASSAAPTVIDKLTPPAFASRKEASHTESANGRAVRRDQPAEQPPATQLVAGDQAVATKDLKKEAEKPMAPATPPPSSKTGSVPESASVGQVQVQAAQQDASAALRQQAEELKAKAKQQVAGATTTISVDGAPVAGPIAGRAGDANGFLPQPQLITGFRARAARITPVFSFRYEVANGHLKIIPAAEGYLLVKSGAAGLFGKAHIIAATLIDIPLPAGIDSVAISFAALADAPQKLPIPQTSLSGTVEDSSGTLSLSISIPLKPPE